MYPHEYLEGYLAEIMGRRSAVLEPLNDMLLRPLVIGLADQLSIYQDQRLGRACITVGDVQLREGAERAYVLIELTDAGRPLRLAEHTRRWDMPLESSREADFVEACVARRWRFIERNRALLDHLLAALADQLVAYYQRRPHARFTKGGMPRFLEGVDATWLAVELDERAEATKQDRASRYAVQ